MQKNSGDGQLSLFAPDSYAGKMWSGHIAAPREKTSSKSCNRSSKLKNHTFILLNLQPGAGNILGPCWEYDPAWLGPPGTLNTSECPKDVEESSLSQILLDSVPSKYYLSEKSCRGILKRADKRGKRLPEKLELALKLQAGIFAPNDYFIPSGEAFHIHQRDEGIDLGGVSGALMATQNMQMQTFVTQEKVFCLHDQGGERIDCFTDQSGTLLAQTSHTPVVYENHGIDGRYTGPHDVVPTMSARYGTGGNNVPFVTSDEPDNDPNDDPKAPETFRQHSRLSQHISFLKDFFRSYKDFTDRHIDTIELMLERLYAGWNLSDETDFSQLGPEDYPTLSDLYTVMEDAYENYDSEEKALYPAPLLQEVLLGLHSMCIGAESKFFNGHTNVESSRFLVFGVKNLMNASGNIKNALLFNILSFLSDKLLTEGNSVAAIDELYLFLSNPTTIEYIRNFMKRVRKKNSAVLLASQNIEDFALPGVAEMTRPLFSIPTHQFLFNAGSVDRKFFMENLQLEESEFELIRYPQRGTCLYKCGNERYLLDVHAPAYKEKLFGTAGGK